MKFNLHDEMWLYALGGIVLAAMAVGIALLLTHTGIGGHLDRP